MDMKEQKQFVDDFLSTDSLLTLLFFFFNQKLLIIVEYIVDLILHTPTSLFHILHVRDPKVLFVVFRSICGIY